MAWDNRRLRLSWLGRIVVIIAMVLTVCGTAPPVLAADRPTDLASLLLRPNWGSNWIPIPSGVRGQSQFGPLDAKTIAGGDPIPATSLLELASVDFTRGYRRGWQQQASHTVLAEEVDEFLEDSGAVAHLAGVKVSDQHTSTFKGSFDTPGLDSGYGDQFVDNTGFHTISVLFTKGNLMFFVALSSSNPINTDMVLNQARYVYLIAPDESNVPGATLGGLASPMTVLPYISFASAIVIVGGSVVLGSVVVMVVVCLAILWPQRRRKRPAKGEGTQSTFSSDRRYWWDGNRWQDSAILVPPTALRSSDGAQWFDGVLWRPVPPAPVLPAGQDRSRFS